MATSQRSDRPLSASLRLIPTQALTRTSTQAPLQLIKFWLGVGQTTTGLTLLLEAQTSLLLVLMLGWDEALVVQQYLRALHILAQV